MKIEAVTVCCHYSDFLAHTIVHNKPLFDRLVVVTHPADRRTRDLCEHYRVECVATEAMHANEKCFDKGAAITEGLARLDGDQWIAHLDADIVLPARTRGILERAELDPRTIYGIDRLMCPSFEAWAKYLAHPEVQHSCEVFVQANAFPLGVRIAKVEAEGYVPIGFFQLWHAGATGIRTYPGHGAVDRSDMSFALQWPRGRRALVPEIVAIHLATDDGREMGANWRGRTTPPFGPVPSAPPPAPRDGYAR